MQGCAGLTELHVQHNLVVHEGEWQRLIECGQLRVVDARDNPVHVSPSSRPFAIYCLPHLQLLDEQTVSEDERDAALDRYCGRLSDEGLVAAAGDAARMGFIEQLSLTHCRLRSVDTITHSALPNLTTLCIDHNELSSTHSLQPHARLTALHCSSNRLTELASLHAAISCRQRSGLLVPEVRHHSPDANWLSVAYPRLRRLVVDHNQLTSMQALHLTGLRSLRLLSAAGNRIARLDLPLSTTLPRLAQLVLADNKIIRVEPAALSQCNHLTTLQLDGNQLSTLPALPALLPSLTALHLADNAVCDVDCLAHRCLPALQLLTLAGCPIARRHSYRSHVLQLVLPSALVSIDGIAVTADEMDAALEAVHDTVDSSSSASIVAGMQFAAEVTEGGGANRQQSSSRERQRRPAEPQQQQQALYATINASTAYFDHTPRSTLPALDNRYVR